MLMMNDNVVVVAGCEFDEAGVGQQHQPFDPLSKSPDGMTQASSMERLFPFTNAQWKELERQAMVFKYMMHSIPIPYDLLLPFITSAPTDLPVLVIRKDTNLLKFLKNGDPEPGRCRRTDGKKWRCANGVAIDQKYCEKHVHRSRPRSRKHVEASTASDLNKIHKKPCLDQAQNQNSIFPQVSGHQNNACLNTGGFTNDAFLLLRNEDLADEQWQQLMQFQQHHQSSLKKPTSAQIDQWTLNSSTSSAQHGFVSLGLSMGHGSYTNDDVSDIETKTDETHDWLSQSGGPLGEVLRHPLTSSSTTTTNGASSPSCT